MKFFLVISSVLAATTWTSSAAIYTAQDAFKVGVFVSGDFNVGNSESEGTVIVGGNLNASENGYQVSLRPGANKINGNALVVAGELKSSSNNGEAFKVSGNVVYGSIPDNKPSNWVSGKLGGANGTVNQGITDVTQAFTDLKALSMRIAGKVGTAVVFNGLDSEGKITQNTNTMSLPNVAAISDSTIMANSFRLYTIKASDMAAIGNTLSGTTFSGFGANDLFVFNIINDLVGTNTVTYNFSIATEWADNILWNISSENLNIRTSNSQFSGSLLAPGSTYTQGNQNFVGTLIAKSYDGTSAAELHPVLFGGQVVTTTTTTSPVPEPTSAVVGALLALGLMRRQRR